MKTLNELREEDKEIRLKEKVKDQEAKRSLTKEIITEQNIDLLTIKIIKEKQNSCKT